MFAKNNNVIWWTFKRHDFPHKPSTRRLQLVSKEQGCFTRLGTVYTNGF